VTVSGTAVSGETDLPQPSFYVSFEDGLEPQIAAKGTVAKYVSRVTSGTAQFVPGIAGQGLCVGHGSGQYTREGNMHPDEGTVTLWARALGWAPDDGGQHSFLATSYITDGANRALSYYGLLKYHAVKGWPEDANNALNVTAYYAATQDGKTIGCSVAVLAPKARVATLWRARAWHFYAFTYNRKLRDVTLYMDGLPVAHKRVPGLPDQLGALIVLGNGHRPAPDLVVDEVRLYKTELTDSQVRRLYELDAHRTPAPISSPVARAKTVREKAPSKPAPVAAGKPLSPAEANPLLHVPPCIKPPTIDGRFSETEWAGAAAITGFRSINGQGLDYRQARAYFTYDRTHLYLCVRSPIFPKGRRLSAMHKRRDIKWYGDDVIEMLIDPHRRNHQGARPYYYFIGSSAGLIFDLKSMPGIGQESDRGWNGKWQFENSVDADWWTAELAIAQGELSERPIQDQDTWCFNFTRTYTGPVTWTTWSRQGLICRPGGAGEICFNRNAPCVRLLSLTDLLAGKVGLEMELRTAAGAADEVVECRFAVVTSGKTVFEKVLERTLRAGRPERIVLDEAAPLGEANRLDIQVRSKESGVDYFRDRIPFARTTPKPTLMATRQDAYLYGVRYLPSQHRIHVDLDLSSFEHLKRVDNVQFQALDPKGRIVAQAPLPLVDEVGTLSIEFDAPDGVYRARVLVKDEAGKALSSRDLEFVKRTYPWSHGRTRPDTRKVLQPWTPIKVSDEVIRCWGRQYQLGPTGLPHQITSTQPEPSWGRPADASILAAPVRLVAERAGRQLALRPLAPQPDLVEAADDRVRFESRFEAPGLQGHLRGTAEYDGHFWYELTVDESKPLEHLRLEISLRAPYGRYLHAVTDVLRSGMVGIRLPERQGALWQAGGMVRTFYGTFTPYVWLGDEDRGLCWFADSDRGWRHDDEDELIEIVRDGGAVTLVVRLFTRATGHRADQTIGFGLMATPVKPRPVGWRIWSADPDWPPVEGTRRYAPFFHANNCWDSSTIVGNYPYDMALHCQRLGQEKARRRMDKLWMYTSPYNAGGISLPELVAYRGEWIEDGEIRAGNYSARMHKQRFFNTDDKGAYTVANNNLVPSFVDYLHWCLDDLLRHDGIDVLYEDNDYPRSLVDLEQGFGYRRPDGRLQPECNIRLLRHYQKGVQALFQRHGRADFPNTISHMSTSTVVPYLSFAHIAYNGEWREVSKKELDFIDRWPLDYFLAEGMGRNYGLVPCWLPMMRYAPLIHHPEDYRLVLRGLIGTLLLHDICLWSSPHREVAECVNIEKVKARFGMGQADVRFYGYWSNAPVVSTGDKDVKCSIWHRPGKVLAVCLNRSRQSKRIRLRVSLAKLGLGAARCADAENTRPPPARASDGWAELDAEVGAHDFRLFSVKAE